MNKVKFKDELVIQDKPGFVLLIKEDEIVEKIKRLLESEVFETADDEFLDDVVCDMVTDMTSCVEDYNLEE